MGPVIRPAPPCDAPGGRSSSTRASFVAAFVIGEGLISVIAEDVDEPAPGEILLAATPALVVFVLPGLLALWFGLRAVRLGRNDGKAPAALGAVVGLGFVGLNLASYVLGLLLG